MVVFVLAFGQAKAKEECKRLIKRKDELENELEQVSMYLARPDVKSFRMVDEEGFPNTDSATLYAIRSARNKQASLCRCMTIFSHPYLLLCCCFPSLCSCVFVFVFVISLSSTVLRTDLKNIMAQIEQALHKYHECVAAAEQAHQASDVPV